MTAATAPRNFLLLAVILAVAVFFRFYAITEIPPGLWPDEAANGVDALQALASGNFKIFYPENNGREGLFINIQALAVKVFGNEPWVLRVVSAIFGILTVLGLYLVTKELFGEKSEARSTKYETDRRAVILRAKPEGTRWRSFASLRMTLRVNLFRISNFGFRISHGELIALLSAFFLATSFWHVNFSRIGFRAISVPFFAVFGMYWLLKALRTGKISSAVLAGIFTGLGFHTYIAFRFMPFVLAVPIVIALRQWWNSDTNMRMHTNDTNGRYLTARPCIPCIVTLFLFITFVVALPIGLYFFQHPEDFASRAAPISIFADPSPLKAFVKSNILTLGMFNVWGDCNPRHNFFCYPQLYWPVGILFIIGFVSVLRSLFRRPLSPMPYTLFSWFFFMMFPSTLTREGLPHALRAIGMIPPVFILAGLGAITFRDWLREKIIAPLEETAEKSADKGLRPQLKRIKKELWILALALLLWIAAAEGIRYFLRWAPQPAVEQSFETSKTKLAYYIRAVPSEVPVYVVVNEPSLPVYGISLNAQPVVFLTHGRPNTFFVGAEKIETIPPQLERAVIVALHTDRKLLAEIAARYPNGTTKPALANIVPFVIPKNN